MNKANVDVGISVCVCILRADSDSTSLFMSTEVVFDTVLLLLNTTILCSMFIIFYTHIFIYRDQTLHVSGLPEIACKSILKNVFFVVVFLDIILVLICLKKYLLNAYCAWVLYTMQMSSCDPFIFWTKVDFFFFLQQNALTNRDGCAEVTARLCIAKTSTTMANKLIMCVGTQVQHSAYDRISLFSWAG